MLDFSELGDLDGFVISRLKYYEPNISEKSFLTNGFELVKAANSNDGAVKNNSFSQGCTCEQEILLGEELTVSQEDDDLNIFKDFEGIAMPYFFLRFVSYFFTASEQVLSVYESMGFKTYGDLLNLDSNCIKSIVNNVMLAGEDTYCSEIHEAELIAYCRAKERVKQSCDSLGLQLSDLFEFSNYTQLVEQVPGLCLPTKNRPFFGYEFDSNSFRDEAINEDEALYLRAFGIADASVISKLILNKPITTYQLSDDYMQLRAILRPFNVLSCICDCLMNTCSSNAFGEDRELCILNFKKEINDYRKSVAMPRSSNGERNLKIVQMRESGMTLEAIASRIAQSNKSGFTRERIRQIVVKFVSRNKGLIRRTLKSLLAIVQFVPAEFLKCFPGASSFIESEAAVEEPVFLFDEDMMIVGRRSDILWLQKERTKVFAGEKLDWLRADSIYSIYGISLYCWLSKKAFLAKYDPYPAFIIQKSPLYEIGQDYLLFKGDKGFDVNKDIDEARAYFSKRTNIEHISDRAIVGDVLRNDCVLRRMSTYISPNFVPESSIYLVKEILDNEHFDDYGQTANWIYKKYQGLLNNFGIDNPYYFYGIASYFIKEGYKYTGRGLRIVKGNRRSLGELAADYIEKNGPIVKENDFKKALSLQPSALQQIKVVTKYDRDTLVLTKSLEMSFDEFKCVEDFIDERLNEDGYCSCETILKSELAFDEGRNGFIGRNKASTATRLCYLLDVIANRYGVSKYYFWHIGNLISYANDKINSKVELIKRRFAGSSFSIDEVEGFLQSFGFKQNANNLRDFAIFINKKFLILKDDLPVTSEQLKEISNLLNEKYHNEIYILGTQGLSALNISGHNSLCFGGAPIYLASALSSLDSSDWTTPVNDLPLYDDQLLSVLAHKRFFGGAVPKVSELIQRSVFAISNAGSYVSFEDIAKMLIDNELLSKRISDIALQKIFERYLYSQQIVRIPG